MDEDLKEGLSENIRKIDEEFNKTHLSFKEFDKINVAYLYFGCASILICIGSVFYQSFSSDVAVFALVVAIFFLGTWFYKRGEYHKSIEHSFEHSYHKRLEALGFKYYIHANMLGNIETGEKFRVVENDGFEFIQK